LASRAFQFGAPEFATTHAAGAGAPTLPSGGVACSRSNWLALRLCPSARGWLFVSGRHHAAAPPYQSNKSANGKTVGAELKP